MLISSLSKGVLIKGVVLAAGGTGIGITWWQLYDNLYPQTLEEETGGELIFSKPYTNLDDVPNLTFEDSTNYRSFFFKKEGSSGTEEFKKFKDSDCINKFLPGEINDIQYQIENTSNPTDTSLLEIDNFNNISRGACLNINIRYNDKKDVSKKRGMMGKVELIAWDSARGVIMSSIISNLKGKFSFVNKLTFLQKSNNNTWVVLGSAIWTDSTVKDLNQKNVIFSLGDNEAFSFSSEKDAQTEDISGEFQEYDKLFWWYDDTNSSKDLLLGFWKIKIDGKNTDLWRDYNDLKLIPNIKSKTFYKQSNTKWFKDRSFKLEFKNGHLGWKGNWMDVRRECIDKKNKWRNICLGRKN